MAKDFARSFYLSGPWKRTRKAYYKYRLGMCERCYEAGEIVHHKIWLTPQNINDPKIALDWKNLELLCLDCHNKEHKTKPNERYRFDEKGRLLPPG